MAEFVMPALGSDMTEGKLIEWKKRVGDQVKKGDILAEVDTEKSAIEVESFHTGVIEQLLAHPGDTLPVGTVMAVIREEEKQVPAAGVISAPVPKTPTAPPARERGRLHISPAARKLAGELGVDPASLQGTGPDGAITLEDVQRSAAHVTPRSAASVSAPASAADRQARMRQTIAAAMARSKREIPHYYLSTTIDMGPALAWLAKENGRRSVADRFLYGVLLVKAVALALRQFPEFNALWKDGQAVPGPHINVGMAISLRQGGLIAPAIHDTDQLSLGELMKRLQDLVQRARTGALRSSELSDPTITVTSLGEQGVETVFGVIYPPQVALVGFGTMVQRPCIVDGTVVARPVITATLSGDHRVSDGHRGGLFLSAIGRLLQEPMRL